MTNYNDGKWHGWNGGECPVHPETDIECALLQGDGRMGSFSGAAEGIYWDDELSPVIAFRVTKEYREPREWFAVGKYLHDSMDEAEAFLRALDRDYPGMGYSGQPVTRVREVLE